MLNSLLGRIPEIAMQNLNRSSSYQTQAGLCEYLLVVHPSEEVKAKILDERSNFENKYEQQRDARFSPQIIVADFVAKEAMEETFIRWIQNICNLQKSFTVTLNNYSGLPSCGLYLRIQDEEPFRRLSNALRILDGFMQSNNCPALKLENRPHLNFVTGLSQYSFDNAIKEYSLRTFHESFRVDKLVLLKKEEGIKSRLINTFILPSPLS